MFKFWSSPCLTQCPFYHTLVLRDEVGRCQTDQMDHGWGWLTEKLGSSSVCKSNYLQPGPLLPCTSVSSSIK